jgi:hypothetical protein
MNEELNDKLLTSYRNAWLETTNQLLIAKVQNDLLNDKLQQLQKEIGANKQQALGVKQPVPVKPEQK